MGIRCSYHVASHVGTLVKKSPDPHLVVANQPPMTTKKQSIRKKK